MLVKFLFAFSLAIHSFYSYSSEITNAEMYSKSGIVFLTIHWKLSENDKGLKIFSIGLRSKNRKGDYMEVKDLSVKSTIQEKTRNGVSVINFSSKELELYSMFFLDIVVGDERQVSFSHFNVEVDQTHRENLQLTISDSDF